MNDTVNYHIRLPFFSWQYWTPIIKGMEIGNERKKLLKLSDKTLHPHY